MLTYTLQHYYLSVKCFIWLWAWKTPSVFYVGLVLHYFHEVCASWCEFVSGLSCIVQMSKIYRFLVSRHF